MDLDTVLVYFMLPGERGEIGPVVSETPQRFRKGKDNS